MKSQGTNEFFYIDTNRHAEENKFDVDQANHNQITLVDNYNSGFTARKALLGVSTTVNAEIPLNRYGFFQSLYLQLLPNSKIQLDIDIESDADLV